jgi:AraC-like DNA-binding protein
MAGGTDSIHGNCSRLSAGAVRGAAAVVHRRALSTTAIAYRCGFGTCRTFFRAYRRIQGKTPAAFRARLRGLSPPPFSSAA